MPVSYSWRLEEGVVLLESDEVATFEEWKAAVTAAVASDRFRPGIGVVHDFSRVAKVLSAAEAQLRVLFLARICREHAVRRWATVAARPAQFGMSRVEEALSQSEHVVFRAFTDRDEAVAWVRDSSPDPTE